MPLEVQRVSRHPDIPADADFASWVRAVLGAAESELVIRVVDEAEMRQINRQYRRRDHATNVLSFAPELDPQLAELMIAGGAFLPLGDIVICAPVVAREASEQDKPAKQHWAHLVVHGMLHLQGFDHQQDEDARVMEAREAEILGTLGLPDPYVRQPLGAAGQPGDG
jgi:probable rRNA maturation factor